MVEAEQAEQVDDAKDAPANRKAECSAQISHEFACGIGKIIGELWKKSMF
jgi:hypothetical protein